MRWHSNVLRVSAALTHRLTMNRLEKPFAAGGYAGQPGLDPVWTPLSASSVSRVLVTAPHSVRHYREGEPKDEDTFTGALARALGQKLEATSVTATAFEWHPDEFALRQDTFAKALRPHLTRDPMIFDLHGMRDKWKIDVCLGTGNYPEEFALRLSDALKSSQPGLTCELNNPFAAKEDYTLTRAAQDAEVRHAVQVEFSRTYRKRLMTEPALFQLVAEAFDEVTRDEM